MKLKISQKLPLIIVGMAVIAAGVTGYIAIDRASSDALITAEDRIVAMGSARKSTLENYLGSIQQDLSALSHSGETREALAAFENGWNLIEGDKKEHLQKLYIHDNPNPIGAKENLDYAPDESEYSAAHKKYHPFFRHFLRQKGYYDIFLFSKDGDLVYTVFKELDYATSMHSGQWKDTDLANVFRDAAASKKDDFQSFYDFEPYAPSNNVPASFIAQPILDEVGVFVGVIAFQMPIGRINSVMQMSDGMGESGETYITGADGLMRSDSRFLKEGETSILKTKVTDEAISAALKGEKGVHEISDYRGISVMSSYQLLDFLGTRWVVLAEIDMAEIMAPIDNMRVHAMGATGIALLVIALIGFAVSRQIAGPITKMTDVMKVLANNDFSVSIPGRDRHDEIGQMASAVQVFKENGMEAERLRKEQVEAEKRAEAEKRQMMEDLASDFENKVGGVITSLATAAEEMRNSSQEMKGMASDTEKSSTTVAAASEEASANVGAVAAATEELTASSREIASQVTSVAQSARNASELASGTVKHVTTLSNLAKNIGEVVFAIKDIAEQTNLLALNAAIEAARAGDSGKGFAVVAEEVKKLAEETSKKTEEIDSRITEIQKATQESVKAVERILEGISSIDSLATSAAGAVEEQNAATSEIGRNVNEAASGTRQVSEIIVAVQASSQETGSSAEAVLTAASEVAGMAENLSMSVREFLQQIRSGSQKSSSGQG